MPEMIVLSTDFGLEGPYIGQVKAVLYQQAPSCHIIDLFSNLPSFNPKASAALLDAYSRSFPEGSVFLSIVDPGVGMPERLGVVVKANGHWFVGPDNGLFDLVIKRDSRSQCWEIIWQPDGLSNSFHARDLFAPMAAELALEKFPHDRLRALPAPDDTRADFDYPHVVYIDHFGNLITGICADDVETTTVVKLCAAEVGFARTFGEVAFADLFWYKNSNGLLEVASNASSAAEILNASVGDVVTLR